jgi:hypothetical protein
MPLQPPTEQGLFKTGYSTPSHVPLAKCQSQAVAEAAFNPITCTPYTAIQMIVCAKDLHHGGQHGMAWLLKFAYKYRYDDLFLLRRCAHRFFHTSPCSRPLYYHSLTIWPRQQCHTILRQQLGLWRFHIVSAEASLTCRNPCCSLACLAPLCIAGEGDGLLPVGVSERQSQDAFSPNTPTTRPTLPPVA